MTTTASNWFDSTSVFREKNLAFDENFSRTTFRTVGLTTSRTQRLAEFLGGNATGIRPDGAVDSTRRFQFSFVCPVVRLKVAAAHSGFPGCETIENSVLMRMTELH